MTNGLPVPSLIPPMLGFDQCENAAKALSGSALASAPLMTSKMRIWMMARPPLGAGSRGLKNEPSRAFTWIGRMTPPFCGKSASVNTLTANRV